VFHGTLIACYQDEGEGSRPLGCASAFSFTQDGVALACTGHPPLALAWDEVTAVAWSGDRYGFVCGRGELAEYEALLEVGIPQGRARVCVGDDSNEWVLDAAWLPFHKDLLDSIDCAMFQYCPDLDER
jgi:hypothetical protein